MTQNAPVQAAIDISESSEPENAYDAVIYPSHSFSVTHIGRLGAIGRLFGMESAHPAKARVLELGCGTGINLLAMAQLFPEAKFIGVDLSKAQIEIAERAAKESGLGNSQFLHGDLAELGEEIGTFDYIIAHGVYSWIPDSKKEALLRVCKQRLLPNGIAYVSYNCLPGWKMRGALRDMMLMHTGSFVEETEKVDQAKELLKFLSSASNQESPYGKFLSQELELLLKCDDAYIVHEFLEADNDAFYFSEFHRQAGAAGLFYLGDGEPATMMMADIPKEAQATFAQLKDNLAATEQYLDFLRNRTFRCSLLCHPGLPIDRDVKPSRVTGFTVVPHIKIKQSYGDGLAALFQGEGDSEISVSDPVVATIFEAAAIHDSISVDALSDSLIERLKALKPDADEAQLREIIGHTLLRGLFSKLMDFYLAQHDLPMAPVGKPIALPLARWQSSQGARISNFHLGMREVDAVTARFVQCFDGTRTEAELKKWLIEAEKAGNISFKDNDLPVRDTAKVKALVDRLFSATHERLLRQGLLLPGS
jgi:SAM-dependent methyltransferase